MCTQPYAAMCRLPSLMPHYARSEHHASMASRPTRKQCCIFSRLQFSPLSTQPKPSRHALDLPDVSPLLMINSSQSHPLLLYRRKLAIAHAAAS